MQAHDARAGRRLSCLVANNWSGHAALARNRRGQSARVFAETPKSRNHFQIMHRNFHCYGSNANSSPQLLSDQYDQRCSVGMGDERRFSIT